MAHAINLKDEIFEEIQAVCLKEYEKETIELSSLAMRLMDIEGIPMHYPYHHYIVPAVLLTAACKKTNRDREELDEMLDIAMARAKNVLGGFCGNYGACGSGIGTGIFMSVFTDTSPMSEKTWQWANEITGVSLQEIAKIPGPRCCKRTGYLAFQAAVPYVKEKLGIELDLDGQIKCKYHERNKECKKALCPFYPQDGGTDDEKAD